MTFDCDKLKPKCRASCCAPFPMPVDHWDKHKHKVARRIIAERRFVSPIMNEETRNMELRPEALHIIAEGEQDEGFNCPRCPFLTKDLKCNIYEDRPFMCREFGSESHIFMSCTFQDKNGKVRTRQQMRAIGREQLRYAEKLYKLGDVGCQNPSQCP